MTYWLIHIKRFIQNGWFNRNLTSEAIVNRPCPKWNTSCALAVLQTYIDRHVSVKSTRPYGVPFLILAFRSVNRYAPSIRTSAEPTLGRALRHESADSEEDREGLGCLLGQGLMDRWITGSLDSFKNWSIHGMKHPVAALLYKTSSTFVLAASRTCADIQKSALLV